MGYMMCDVLLSAIGWQPEGRLIVSGDKILYILTVLYIKPDSCKH